MSNEMRKERNKCAEVMRKYPTLMSSFYWHYIVWVLNINFIFPSPVCTPLFLFHIMCYSNSVSFMPAFGLIVCAKFFFGRKHVFFLKSLLLLSIGVLQQKRRQNMREKTTQKSMWWKGYKQPYRLEFWVCLKIYIYLYVYTYQKDRTERALTIWGNINIF